MVDAVEVSVVLDSPHSFGKYVLLMEVLDVVVMMNFIYCSLLVVVDQLNIFCNLLIIEHLS